MKTHSKTELYEIINKLEQENLEQRKTISEMIKQMNLELSSDDYKERGRASTRTR